ncbi:MAG: lysophospholipase [Deltaproteobacteria bacterium]|nr:lysophospholipase [Deltaproteobacteria bacterium]
MSKNSEQKALYNKGMFDGHDGFRLFERSWLPEGEPKAAVIIIHGYAEHSERYTHVAEYLTRSQYAVYAFDLRMHGRSGGVKAYVKAFEDYLADMDIFIKKVRESIGKKPLFVLGHSMGGTIAVLYVIQRKTDIRGLILTGPALKLGEDIPPILIKLSGFIGAILPHLPTMKLDCSAISRDPEVIRKYDTDQLVYRGGTPARTGAEIVKAIGIIQERMAEITLPILIMHGTGDRLANVDGSKELYKRARSKDKALKLYEGFYHEILNEPEKEQVLRDIVAWLDAHQ